MLSRRHLAPMLGLGALAVAAPGLSSPAFAQAAEGTFAAVRKAKKLRVGAIVGTEPYFHKDIATGAWSGFCISMGNDLAKALECETAITETTWGTAVLDLQSNKIDIMFGLSATPQRALALDFSRPFLNNTFTAIGRPDLKITKWDDLNKPEMRVAFDMGSTHDSFTRRVLPKATAVSLKSPDDAVLAVQAGRADVVIQVVMLALVSVKKNPRLGKIFLPTPVVQQPTCIGMRVDPDQRMRSFVDSWLEYNKSLGVVRGYIIDNLSLVGVMPEDVPPDIQW